MKKILIALTIICFIGLIGSVIVSQTIRAASGKGARDPHTHLGSSTLCYNTVTIACDSDADPEG